MIRENYKKMGHVAILILLVSAIVFPTLGKVSLWEIDEGRYLICAQNAINKGKWLIPEYNGKPRIAKPPLMVWLIASTSVILNHGKVNEFTARVPSAIAAIFTVILLYLLVLKLYQEPNLAFLSSLTLSTCYLFIKYARFAITDMVLLFFITASIYFLAIGFLEEKQPSIIAGFVFMGLGFMDKGPVAFVIPTLVILIFLFSREKLKKELLKEKAVIVGFFIFAIISLWWPLYVGRPYWEKFILASNVKRFAENPTWKTSMLFYIYNFPAHFFIWSALFPLIAKLLKEKKPDLSLFYIWFSVVFVLFSMSDTKRSSYILPLYPAASVITGWALWQMKKEQLLKNIRKFALISEDILFLSLFAVFIAVLIKLAKHNLAIKDAITLIAAMIIFGLICLKLRGKTYRLFLTLSIIFSLSYTNVYQPIADRTFHSAKYCSLKIKHQTEGKPLFVFGSLRANELYYIGRVIRKLPKNMKKTVYVYTRRCEKFEKKFPKAKKVLSCSYQKERLCLYILKGKPKSFNP